MSLSINPVRPATAYRPAANAGAVTTAEAPKGQAPAPAAPIKATAGGRSGVGGVLLGLLLNGFGPISGLLSIGNDVRELKSDPGNKAGHMTEIAGDVMNIASGVAGFVSAPLAGLLAVGGMVVKTTGEMIAGRD
jgi:hypothetical protein